MKKRIVLISLLAVIFVLTGCGKNKVAAVEEEDISTPVEVTVVAKGSIADIHRFGGTVTAKDSVAVLPDTNGKVAEVLVEVGDLVQKGDVIARIDASRAGQNFNLSPVKAPCGGTVTTLNASLGAMVGPASPVAIVQSLDNLEISFSVIERYVSQVAEGNKAYVSFDAFPDETFEAHISHVSPVIDVNTRTLSVKAKLDREDRRVIAGMFARLSVVTTEKDGVIVVPASAVTVGEKETFAYVVDSASNAKKVTVTTGIRQDDVLEITGGLNVGDKLVTKGQGLLSDGVHVRTVN
ncbi:MAG: efflux RND transporter periplasmic adaptor subunit [Sphaerochaetaceae bacterium]|nr:efflux RND transporter periplasmic adaptor subunit [Sphaerochaetaceae bacterium]